jgi:hypothetical protein
MVGLRSGPGRLDLVTESVQSQRPVQSSRALQNNNVIRKPACDLQRQLRRHMSGIHKKPERVLFVPPEGAGLWGSSPGHGKSWRRHRSCLRLCADRRGLHFPAFAATVKALRPPLTFIAAQRHPVYNPAPMVMNGLPVPFNRLTRLVTVSTCKPAISLAHTPSHAVRELFR